MTRLEFLDENTGFDRVIESYATREFTEFIVSCGGDVVTYRVYGPERGKEEDFTICCK